MNQLKDISYLQMAYALAEKARGWASPNPYVGAVIVKKDTIIGYGYHEKPGKPHAEDIALERAGSLAAGGTAYITLEPCTHFGRTPPCVDKILQSKLKRVVVSNYDPNPVVYKNGIKKLQKAGIDLSIGLLKEKNQKLNEAYIKYITKKTPLVMLKAAISLDGKTATHSFSSKWISSTSTREYMHLVRGEFDAIMVGINTILKDDPELTVRHSNWKGKPITRIILDTQLKLPLTAKILKTIHQGDILVFASKDASQKKVEVLSKKGIKVISLNRAQARLNLNKVLAWLGQHRISSVLVEGGGFLQTTILEKQLADKLLVTISPKLIGGIKAPTFFQGKGIKLIEDSFCLRKSSVIQIEDDIIVEGYF